MITGNKGEWSELYAFLKLLSDGKVYGADEKVNLLPSVCYDIIKVLKAESEGKYEYLTGKDITIVDIQKKERIVISSDEFRKNALFLFSKIKSQPATTGSFSVPSIESFMKKIKATKLGASSRQKADIKLEIHDDAIGDKLLGFSIKSCLGANSTLLNAGGDTTNLIYEITDKNFTKQEIEKINSISTRTKMKDRIAKIKTLGGKFEFHDLANQTFKSNLELIDTNMSKIVANMVLNYYLKGNKMLTSLTDDLYKSNICNIKDPLSSDFYKVKTKNFLLAIALGMVPGKRWDGEYQADGGYIIVKESGDIVCYHIFNINKFKDYLLNHTYLETPSTTRHKFGKIYQEKGKFFFKLNLQVRFTMQLI